ncbi:hypothetical protein ACWEF6_02675 [Amycolatopsis sp. NPDC004772]
MSRQPGQPGRVGHRWRQAQQAVFDTETHCWLCGGYVDQRLSAQGPLAKLSRSADHLVQLQHGGDPHARSNCRLAHIGCNSARSNRLRGLARENCACSHGRPCEPLNPTQPRGYVELDPSEV